MVRHNQNHREVDDPSSPMYLHPNDNPGAILVTELLNGSNYINWNRSMYTALEAKKKVGFIDGSSLKPEIADPLYGSWIRCNSMVVSWLKNSTTPQIRSSLLHLESAMEIWLDLRERFSKGNVARIYADRSKNSNIRSQILQIDPLPPISNAFALAIQEEHQRSIAGGSLPMLSSQQISEQPSLFSNAAQTYGNRGKKKLMCTHCGRTNHTVDRCFALHGFPPGFGRGRGRGRGSAQDSSGNFHKSVHNVDQSTSDATGSTLNLHSGRQRTLLQGKAAKYLRTELISGDGDFNEAGFNDFLNSVKLHKHGVSYAVVAIMGPQSSGKSTLMNHLFRTNFREMNAKTGRSQTTKGIWIAKAPDREPLTMVLDTEGTDGLERGQDDTAFEKQSALFALEVADIVIINMWCHDIGRENAGNRPLFKTIFEAMMRLFSPHKTTLLFVIRDKTETPFEILERDLRKDVHKIWETVIKPQDREDTPFSEMFNVEVTALPDYVLRKDEFKEEVAQLRLRIFASISPRRLVGEREELPFCSAKKIWDIIKNYKDLDLPPHKVMVDTIRCEEIAMDKLGLFESDKDRLALQQLTEIRLVPGFNAKISSILSRYLSEYDSECTYYEEGVRNAKRQYLESEAFKLVHPAYMKTLDRLRSEAFRSYETRLEALLSEEGEFFEYVRTCEQSCMLHFDHQCSDHAAIEQANWDASIVRQELVGDITKHALQVRTEKLQQIVDQLRERLSTKLTKHLKECLKEGGDNDVWASVRSHLKKESDAAASALSSAVVMFELDTPTVEKMKHDLKQYARNLAVRNFKDESSDSGNVKELMKQRFIITLFDMRNSADHQGSTATEEAYRTCLKLLSTLAVIRLDERYDNVERVLFSSLIGADSGIVISKDPLASITWEEIPPEMTLITPAACKAIWDHFKIDMEPKLRNAASTEDHWSLPYWVIAGLQVLGLSGFLFLVGSLNIRVGMGLLPTILAVLEGKSLLGIVKEFMEGKSLLGIVKEFMEKSDNMEFQEKRDVMMKILKKFLEQFYNYMKTHPAK